MRLIVVPVGWVVEPHCKARVHFLGHSSSWTADVDALFAAAVVV